MAAVATAAAVVAAAESSAPSTTPKREEPSRRERLRLYPALRVHFLDRASSLVRGEFELSAGAVSRLIPMPHFRLVNSERLEVGELCGEERRGEARAPFSPRGFLANTQDSQDGLVPLCLD